MAIYVIADLHLSFNEPKPMNIFGSNWENHEDKIKTDWINKVKSEDTVLHLGDFSWGMSLEDTLKDFEFINNLPGKKIVLKGDHDYWWTTVTSMKKFLNENNIQNVDFLHNNFFEIEDKVFCGTRGWTLSYTDEIEYNEKVIARESNRLKLSLDEAIKNVGHDKEIIVCLHYPPIMKSNVLKEETTPFMEILKEYNIKRCYYGHLHGESIEDSVQGKIDGVDLKLVSSDGVDFKLIFVN